MLAISRDEIGDRLVVGPTDPHRDRIGAIEADRPGIAKTVGCAGLVRDLAGKRILGGRRIDQHIADQVADDTPMRSLQVGTEDMGTSAGACLLPACGPPL